MILFSQSVNKDLLYSKLELLNKRNFSSRTGFEPLLVLFLRIINETKQKAFVQFSLLK